MKDFFAVERIIGKTTSATAQLTFWGIQVYTIFAFDLRFSADTPIKINLELLSNVLVFNLSWTRKRDHAGLNFTIGLFGLELSIGTYDHRHWDDDNDTWVVYREPQKNK